MAETAGDNPQREHRMSEQQTAEATATETEAANPEQETEQQKPSETVDFWKQKAREQEKRAKENAEARRELDTIRESQKSESEKNADRIKQLEAEIETTRLGATRFQIAAEFSLNEKQSAALAHVSSEEGMRELAEAFQADSDMRKKHGNHVPREGNNPKPGEDPMREFTRGVFARAKNSE